MEGISNIGGYSLAPIVAPILYCDVPTFVAVRHPLSKTAVSPCGWSAHHPCPACYVQDPATGVCTPCVVGTESNRTHCDPCPSGTYRDNISAPSCTDCPAGSVTNTHTNTGASNCTRCPAGSGSNDPTVKCAECDKGKFSDVTGQCKNCLPGFHADPGASNATGDGGGTACLSCMKRGPNYKIEICRGGAAGGCAVSQNDAPGELCIDVSVQQLSLPFIP